VSAADRGALVVLGGADGAIATLRAARGLGLRTICVDRRTDAPAIRFADEYRNVSTRDVAGLLAALADRGDLAGVVSPASDVNLPAQYAVARGLGLPCGLSDRAVRASVDKAYFRDVCDRLGLPGPRFVAGDPASVRRRAAQLSYPVIVKPVDSSGGRGVGACARPDDLAEALDAASAHSYAGRVIVEEYLTGSHHTAEAIVVDGRIALFAVGDRTLTAPPHFVTVEHTMPSADAGAGRQPGLAERVRTMLDRVCQQLRYAWGSMNVDIIVTTDGRVVLLELGARSGGNGSAELLGLVHGVDVVGATVDLAVGGRPALAPRRPAHAAFRVLTIDRPGKLVAIHGAEAARRVPGVADLVLAAQPGDHVEPYHRAGAKLGYVMVVAEDESGRRRALDTVEATLRFEVVDADE
jgi:biotin carboxylase